MKAKNQQPITSELDAKEKLIVYVYEYLIHSGAKQAASLFKENIGYSKEIKINDSPGFLVDWWCVFWDLYCAAPDRRMTLPESSAEARAFHDYRVTPISPSITHPSPPQHPSQPHGPQFMGGPRGYGPIPPGAQVPHPRGPPQRMQGVPSPHPQHPGAPHPGGFIPTGSPRYAQHPSGPTPQQPPPHMNQGPGGPMFGPGPEQMGPSPGLNRMTPVGGPPPPQQVVGGPPPQMVGMPGQPQMIGGPQGGQGGPLAPPLMSSMQPPPRNGSQGSSQGGGPPGGNGWPQSNVNYGNVNSPANQPCYTPTGPGSNQGPNQSGGPTMTMMSDGSMMEVKSSPVNGGAGGEPSTPHPDEYVMPVPFGQDANDQCDSAEILKIKQSMQEDTSKMFDKGQSDFGISDGFPDNQGWK